MRKINLILLGAPGAGKGTQAEIISEKYGIPAISTGAIIREEIASGSELGKTVKACTESGALVPDEVVINIIKGRLAKDDCANGFILDGFPRTVPQAEALRDLGVEITDVISIEVADEDIMDRMSGRRVCSGCSKTYHVLHLPSAAGDACEACGAELNVRADDAPEVVRSRLTVYHSTTEPLKEYYSGKGILRTVFGAESVEETTKRTLEALGI